MNIFFLVALGRDHTNHGRIKYHAQDGHAWEPSCAQRFDDEDQAIRLAHKLGGRIEVWNQDSATNQFERI